MNIEKLTKDLEANQKQDGCYFDEQRYGWVRFGNFFPFEVWGNGPFFHDEINKRTKTINLAHPNCGELK